MYGKVMRMNDELALLTNSLDQSIPFDTDQLSKAIEEVIQQALEKDDPSIAFNVGRSLIKASKLAGLGLAELLFTMKSYWPAFETGEEFEDRAFVEFGLSKATIMRYIRDWEMLNSGDIPPQLENKIAEKNMKDINAIATTWASGYDIPEKAWEELADAPDNNAVLGILRDVKGIEPRVSSLVIRMERDGTLRGWMQGEGHFLGYLAVEEAKDDDTVKKAIERIISSSGIVLE